MIQHVVFWARAGFKGALLKIGFGTGEWAPHAAPSPAKATAAVLLCTLITLGSIAAGWIILWHVVLHKINFFRDLLGLNRKHQLESKRRANLEIQRLKKQLGRPL
ncbi:hypothetical protein DUNSADRAFT_15811 [Dunaliella salina]|uniref:Uncharacterized protein n=1 Tax=Dunaliella salina TaxID=3046 RepID=A0ABQ7H1I2_DUNSA|nr:hypothetical protein DUNSADRAFT_15811 [Dunaliella salina]|eukprot:KAF5840717.1 hypothetical protein DUNSADRAFT_15811 [Dunaliella salina]